MNLSGLALFALIQAGAWRPVRFPKPPVPLAGVTITLSTGQTATTDAQGRFTVKVPACWTGTLTPSKDGYKFTPAGGTGTCLQADSVINFTARTVKGKK